MRKAFKIIIWVLGCIILLLLGICVWLNTPSGKNFVRQQAVNFLRKKLKTETYNGEVGYVLPRYVFLKNVLFKDQSKDTLLSAGDLTARVDMLALLHSHLNVRELRLENISAHIYRNAPDTDFNFTYIINAFAGKNTKPKDTT